MDGQLTNRFAAECRRIVHAVTHPSHRITAVDDINRRVVGLFCSCGRVFLDRVPPPMTLGGVMAKIARQQSARDRRNAV